ncbi:hypothetical protein ACQKP0_09760 [Heyndrickxia sp. NPDC080065]|uniref:hypothetical protein n=1 Tax=Heyndrickxia sp. NPDC080065 TaxID=3390568 RepID=UPI003CFEE7C1
MIKVKIKTEGKTWNIPLPYALLNISTSILCSKFLWRNIDKQINKHAEKKAVRFLPLDQKIMKPLLKELIQELKNYKNHVLIDIKTEDGTEVIVKL